MTRTPLPNGVQVLHARHGTIPLVAVRVVLDAGAIRETADTAGLAQLVMTSLDVGAAGRTGEELAWELERLGVELHAEASWDVAWVEATVASERLDPALALIAGVVREPDFPAAEFERIRDEQLAEILQRRQDPRLLANDSVLRLLFGHDAPYGRSPTGLADTVRGVDAAAAPRFHAAHVVPARSAIVLCGDVEPDRAADLARQHFGAWAATGAASPGPPSADASRAAACHIIDRPASVQSEIRVAHAGVERRHPDYFALRVMNTILGGAFTSRLNLNLRERNGFTYGVRSGFAFRRAPGPFIVETAVATDVTARAVEEILSELRSLHEHGATDTEVVDGREYLAGVVPLELQTEEQIAGRLAHLVVYGLPDNYYDGYRAALEAVSTEDVARVANRHLHPDRLTICIVGDAAATRPPLEAAGFGDITVHPPNAA